MSEGQNRRSMTQSPGQNNSHSAFKAENKSPPSPSVTCAIKHQLSRKPTQACVGLVKRENVSLMWRVETEVDQATGSISFVKVDL